MVLCIKKIETRLLKIPLKEFYKLSFTVLEFTSPVVIFIETTDGKIGLGEADPLIPFTNVSSENIFSELLNASKKLIGKEFSSIKDIQEIESELSKEFHGMTVGAIDMALLDLISKSKGVPLQQLLSSTSPKRQRIKVLFPLSDQGVEDDQKYVEE